MWFDLHISHCIQILQNRLSAHMCSYWKCAKINIAKRQLHTTMIFHLAQISNTFGFQKRIITSHRAYLMSPPMFAPSWRKRTHYYWIIQRRADVAHAHWMLQATATRGCWECKLFCAQGGVHSSGEEEGEKGDAISGGPGFAVCLSLSRLPLFSAQLSVPYGPPGAGRWPDPVKHIRG